MAKTKARTDYELAHSCYRHGVWFGDPSQQESSREWLQHLEATRGVPAHRQGQSLPAALESVDGARFVYRIMAAYDAFIASLGVKREH